MSKWFEKGACRSRAACVDCRTGASFRESLVKVGWVAERDFDCPHGINAETAGAEQARALAELTEATSGIMRSAKGVATWAELHLRYLRHDGSDDAKWLMEDFTRRIPRRNCACMRHWLELLKTNPPRWAEAFVWSVEVHNAVNRRIEREQGLKRPCLSVAEARERWGG